MGTWSSSLMRILVLIAGAVVALQASHIISISIAFHAITQDFKNTRSIAGIAVGIGVSMLAIVPARKERVAERKNKTPIYWIDRARLWRNAQQLGLVADSMARHASLR